MHPTFQPITTGTTPMISRTRFPSDETLQGYLTDRRFPHPYVSRLSPTNEKNQNSLEIGATRLPRGRGAVSEGHSLRIRLDPGRLPLLPHPEVKVISEVTFKVTFLDLGLHGRPLLLRFLEEFSPEGQARLRRS